MGVNKSNKRENFLMQFDFPLGISLGVYPTEEIFSSVAAAGITHIELSPHDDDYSRIFAEAENIKQMAEHHGLTLWSLHLQFGRETVNLCAPDAMERERTLAIHFEALRGVAALGVKRVILHGGIPLPHRRRILPPARHSVCRTSPNGRDGYPRPAEFLRVSSQFSFFSSRSATK